MALIRWALGLRWLWTGTLACYVAALLWGLFGGPLVVDAPVRRPDLWLHFAGFGGLTVLIGLSRLVGPIGAPAPLLLTAVASAAFATATEASQSRFAPGRMTDPADLYANLGGVAIGLGLLALARLLAPTEATTRRRTERASGADGSRVAGRARTFALLTAVSRVLGLVRDVACAAVFGTTAVWSAFATAFIVPNLFRRLLGEGALSAAFVPEYTQAATRDAQRGAPLGEGEADRLASLTVALVGALLLAAVALAMLGLSVLTPEADAASRPWNSASVVHLTIVMLPFAPLVCITALLGGMLQAHGRFAPHAGAPIVLNLCMIAFATAGAWLYNNTLREAATVLGVGVVLAGVIQLVWCLLELRGLAGWTLRVRDALPAARRMVARMGPVLIGLGAAQLGMVIDALIAGWPVIAAERGMEAAVFGAAYPLDVQAAAVLYYGQRLYQLPLGVFAIAVATAALPALAGAAKDPAAFAAVLRRGLRLSLFVGLPAAVGLALVREPLVVAAFGGAEQSAWPSISRFSVGDAERVAAVLLAYTPAIAAASANHVLARAFYAAGDTKTPMWIGLGAVTANVALNLWLIWSFAEVGLAIATSVTALGQTIALAIAARLRIPQLGRRLLDGRTAASLFAGAALSVAMGAAVWSALFVTRGMVEPTRSGAALTLLMGVGVGLAVYVAGSAVLRRPELGELLRGRGGGGEAGGP